MTTVNGAQCISQSERVEGFQKSTRP